MKILVTGANGYIGQGVVRALLDKGVEVIAADYACAHIDARACIMEGDMFAVEDPFSYYGKPDVLLHLAWRDGFVHYSDSHINDLPKHYEFIKDFCESGIKRLAVMGSMHEVGFWEGSIDETTPCNPISMYGIAKNALREITEHLTDKNHVGMQWLRGYYIVGNSEYGSSIFSKITVAAKEGKKEFPFTMGLNQFDFIDYDELVRQITAVVCQDCIMGIINVCSGRPEKLADRVERFIRENGYSIKLKYGEFPDRPYDSKAVWGNDEKIRRIMEKI